MNNVQLSKILSSDPITQAHYLGTFAADHLPTALPERFALVANTEKLSVQDGHWVAIFSNNKSIVYYFDSFGEHVDSIACGGFAIYVLRELCAGRSFEEVVDYFVGIKDDDNFIENFLLRNYRFHLHHLYR